MNLQRLKRTIVIAEAGSNYHISQDPKINLDQAYKLIDAAAKAGADAVKFQLFRADKLYASQAGYADYLGKKQSINNIIRENEVPYTWLIKLKRRCQNKKILFLCTPFDFEALRQLELIKTPLYKISSYTINHLLLIKAIARTKKPIILSTGASTIQDIKKAMAVIKREGNDNITLLQCTAKYPAGLDSIQLNVIPSLRDQFKCPVGLSDHSRDPFVAPLGAVALGATVIEKHFTTNNRLPGPDHKFSVTCEELALMVYKIREMESALGKKEKVVRKEEIELRQFCRQKIFAICTIPKGNKLTLSNIRALRPGKIRGGIDAQEMTRIIGKKAKKTIPPNASITRTMIQ